MKEKKKLEVEEEEEVKSQEEVEEVEGLHIKIPTTDNDSKKGLLKEMLY